MGEGGSAALIEQLTHSVTEESNRRRDLARRHFERGGAAAGIERGDAPGVTAAEWVEVTGRGSEVVTERGRLADLIVFSREAASPGSEQRAVLETAMLTASTSRRRNGIVAECNKPGSLK